MVFVPKIFLATIIDEALVAGPAIKKMNTAPAVTPLPIKARAIGIDAVAQTYIGNDIKSIAKYARY